MKKKDGENLVKMQASSDMNEKNRYKVSIWSISRFLQELPNSMEEKRKIAKEKNRFEMGDIRTIKDSKKNIVGKRRPHKDSIISIRNH